MVGSYGTDQDCRTEAEPSDGGPVGRDRLKQRDQVRGTHEVIGAGEDVGREGRSGKGRIPPIGDPHDPDAAAVREAGTDDVLDRVEEVVVHPCTPLLVTRVEEVLAVPRRSPKTDLDAEVAAVGEPLRDRIEPPPISGPRTSVDVEHGRELPALRLHGATTPADVAGAERVISANVGEEAGG